MSFVPLCVVTEISINKEHKRKSLPRLLTFLSIICVLELSELPSILRQHTCMCVYRYTVTISMISTLTSWKIMGDTCPGYLATNLKVTLDFEFSSIFSIRLNTYNTKLC